MVNKRVAWKLPFIHSVFFKRRLLYKKNLLLRIRNSLLPATFVYKRIRVYNGIWYLTTDITGQMLGFKTGAFSYTRRCDPLIHAKHKKKRKKRQRIKYKLGYINCDMIIILCYSIIILYDIN